MARKIINQMSVCDDKILKLKERIDSDLPKYSKAQVKRVREITVSSSLKRRIPVELCENQIPLRLFKKEQPKPALEKVFEDHTAAAIRQGQERLGRRNGVEREEGGGRSNGPRLVWGVTETTEPNGFASGWGKELLESQKKRSNQLGQSVMENMQKGQRCGKENNCHRPARKESIVVKNNIPMEREPLTVHNQPKQVHSIILINLNQQIARRIRLTQGAEYGYPAEGYGKERRGAAELLPEPDARGRRGQRDI